MLQTLLEVHETRWSRSEHLLADIQELLQFLLHATQAAHFKDKPKWTPMRLPRPGQQQQPRRQSTAEEVKRFMAGLGR